MNVYDILKPHDSSKLEDQIDALETKASELDLKLDALRVKLATSRDRYVEQNHGLAVGKTVIQVHAHDWRDHSFLGVWYGFTEDGRAKVRRIVAVPKRERGTARFHVPDQYTHRDAQRQRWEFLPSQNTIEILGEVTDASERREWITVRFNKAPQ